MTDSRSDFIDPRPEAMPLSFADLTEEQRNAGKQAAHLLRGMAREPAKPPHLRSSKHPYLPAIYRENRSNRVVLLDGARGSGKSALLITLLDVYGRALTEQSVPDGYGDWLTPTDRVVPVGLIDLQPLPGSTHLLFHLVANLERVVESMEVPLEHPRLGTAAWHPGGEHESPSRKKWRNFARIAASGWEDNLTARQGKLDAEAFAVEVEQGELRRLDVTSAFHEFMDALVADYRARNNWQSGDPPLFLLAVDDADMNPELAEPLLELVRKLWHPRLAFVLTGDTDLFLRTLAPPHPPPEAQSYRGLFFRMPSSPTDDADQRQRRLLAMDIYAKVIPQAHRCRLPPLSPQQRLEKSPPSIGELLQRFAVPGPRLPSRPGGTLADYFEQDVQVREVLPGRLRSLMELHAALQHLHTEAARDTDRNPSDEAVERIWQWSLETASIGPALRERLTPMVRVDVTTNRLTVEPSLGLGWPSSSFALLLELETAQARLTLTCPLRAEAYLAEPGNKNRQSVASQVSSALVLAADFVSDVERFGVTPPELPSRLSAPLLAYATLNNLQPEGPDLYAWPLPDWNAPLDITLLGKAWTPRASAIPPGSPHAAEEAARCFLGTVLSIGLGASFEEPGTSASSWEALASAIARAARLRSAASKRQRALGEWAVGRAGLLAAPESGLPAPEANALIDALKEAFGKNWEIARRKLYDARIGRAQETVLAREQKAQGALVFKSELRSSRTVNPEGILEGLDKQFPEHHFRSLLVEAAEEVPTQAFELAENLRNVLENVHLHSLNRILGERHMPPHSLANYLTPLRWKWLQQAPAPLLQATRDELRLFTRIQDAGAPALARLWKTACESAGAPGSVDGIQLQSGKLIIAEDLRQQLDSKREQSVQEPSALSFGVEARLQAHVFLPKSASTSFLTVSAPHPVERALEAVLRMAYDHEEDHGEKESGEETPVGWKGLKLQFKNSSPLHLWPVPRWPSLFEWEILEESWQDAVRLTRGIAGFGTTPTSTKVLDGLAYWLLYQCQGLHYRQEHSLKLDTEPSVDAWQTLIRGPRRARLRGQEVRPHIYRPWRMHLPLMATPEAGLSDVAATIILGTILKQSEQADLWHVFENILGEQKSGNAILTALQVAAANQSEWAQEQQWMTAQHLLARRRSRLLREGVEEVQVDALLTDIDNTFPDHPWVKIFGKWNGGVTALPPG